MPTTKTNEIKQTPYGDLYPITKQISQDPKEKFVFERRKEYIPPIIPHNIKNYTITSTKNDCISCHTITSNEKLANHFHNDNLKDENINCFSCHTNN